MTTSFITREFLCLCVETKNNILDIPNSEIVGNCFDGVVNSVVVSLCAL